MSKLREQFQALLGHPGRLIGSRHQLISLLKTLALVVPLTALIWIYAERAQTTTDRAQLEVDVRLADSSQWATILEPANGAITVDLEGPKSKIESFKALLDRRLVVPITGRYESSTEPDLPAAALLNDDPEIAQSGVTIKSASPSTIKVRIDPRIERDVPLRLPDNLPVSVQNVFIDPATVKVRGPSTAMDRLFPTPQSGLAVDLSGAMEKIRTPGQHRLEAVPLLLPRTPGIQITPVRAASVRIEVSAREAEYVIPSVRLAIQKPMIAEGKWKVSTKEKTVTNVRVRGPVEAIARLQPQGQNPPEIAPVAILRLDNDDGAKTDVRRAVVIEGLPQGVILSDNPPEVEFTVKDITAPE